MNAQELIKKAIEARNLSYSPYSNFKVGAALITKNNEIYLGTNIENSSYGLSMCAERNATFNAYCHGVKKEDIVAIAIVADTEKPCSPCGACRQVLSELLPKSAKIYLGNLKGDIMETDTSSLLPFAFGKEDLK